MLLILFKGQIFLSQHLWRKVQGRVLPQYFSVVFAFFCLSLDCTKHFYDESKFLSCKFCLNRNVAQETTTGERYVNTHGQIESMPKLFNFASDLGLHLKICENLSLQTALQPGHKLEMKSDTVVLEPTLPGVGHNWMQSEKNTQIPTN